MDAPQNKLAKAKWDLNRKAEVLQVHFGLNNRQ